MTANDGDVDPEEVEDWYAQEEEDELDGEQESPPLDPGQKYANSQLRVVRETKDYQLDYLQHALQPGRELIDISPFYQRRLRWPTKKKSLLIESLLLNIPVPPIFLFERDYNEYEVIDGRQRLDAVSTFLANDFALTGLEYWPELNRKRFRDLPPVLQKGLLRRSIPAVVLLAETQGADEGGLDVRRVLFDRLNTGGIRLNPQELRNALYPGAFNALLIRLARSSAFTDAWNIPKYIPGEEEHPSDELLRNPLFSALADAELVLRFFALRDAITHGSTGSLRVILDRFMKEHSSVGPEDLLAMEETFTSTLSRLTTVLGVNAFRLPGPGRLSRPLYDALMVALSLERGIDIESHAGEINDALAKALSNSDSYNVLVGRGNTMGAVHERVDLALGILRSGTE